MMQKKSANNNSNSSLINFRNSINVYQSTSLIKKSSTVSVKPEKVQFIQIEPNHKYQIPLFIRNESKEKQKIRIIDPISEQFSIKCQNNPINIAPGLTQKINIYFQLKVPLNSSHSFQKDIFQDKLTIIGNQFKKQIPLISQRTFFKINIPQYFKLGVMELNQEKEYEVDIQNYGQNDIQIGMIQCSSPQISFDKEEIIAKKGQITKLKIKVKTDKMGPFQEAIFFPNGHKMEVKGICTENKVQIVNSKGSKFSFKDFGYVFIGEKLNEKFYLINATPEELQCIVKVFPRNIPDYIDIKVDQCKKTFISRQKPTKLTEQDRKVNIKCQQSKFTVRAFSQVQNTISVQKMPTQSELQIFKKESFVEQNKNNQGFKSYSQILQTLYVKIMEMQKPFKIPLKFTPIIPKIYISKSRFQFNKICPKQTSIIDFHIKNENQKFLIINFPKKGIFLIEGKQKIEPGQSNQYKIIFRPLIAGEYSERLKIKIFQYWEVQLRVYGQCAHKLKQNLLIQASKQNKEMTKIYSQRNLKDLKTCTNFLASERKKRKQQQYVSFLKSKLSQTIINSSTLKQDIPTDLAFDALQNPKLLDKRVIIKPINEKLYYKKDSKPQISILKPKQTILKSNDINKIAEELANHQLGKIEVKCDEINFGNIFIGSKNQKNLSICNKNNKPIIVEVKLGDHQYFCEQKKVQLKKIQAFSQVKFNITIKPLQLGSLRIPINYIINKHHVFEIDIVANVTLLNLGFSSKSLQFSFEKNQCQFQKKQTIQVANYGNTKTKFIIIQPVNKNFSVVSPLQEQINPNSQVPITIRYKPIQTTEKGQQTIHIDKLVVKVIGGAQNVIKLKGTVNEPKFSLKQNQVFFPQVFVFTKAFGKLTLKNQSKVQSAVKIQILPSNLGQLIILDQKKLMMHAQQRKQITYEIHSPQIKQAKGNFLVTIRGGRIFKIPIYINFCFPHIQIIGSQENADINLGAAHILSNHIQREIKVINRMKSEIKLQINKYSSQIDYSLQILTTNQTVEFSLDKQNQSLNQKVIIKQMHSKQQSSFENSKVMNNNNNINKLSKILTLYPNVETNFIIKFVPKIVKQYHFNLPLFLHKATKDIRPITQKIKCCAVQPLFYVNPSHLNFDNIILSESETGYCKMIEIVNPRDDDINWELQNLPSNCVFYCLSKSGKLKAKQKQMVQIFFKPETEGNYEHKLKFFTHKTHKISVEVELSGTAIAPRVFFNKNNILLPPVPLNTESRGIVQINNQGYETLTFTKWKLNNQYPLVNITVNFIDGRTISLAKKKIRIQVIFKSQVPASFTTSLQLCDQFGQKNSIPVSCTAQNSLMTVYNYLDYHQNKKIVFDNLENLIKVLVSNKTKQFDKQVSVSGNLSAACTFIKKWCSFELNVELQEFPQSIIESRGYKLQQIIHKVTNGKINIKKPIYATDNKLSKMQQNYLFYCEIIQTLQNDGAFLNHIRPEFLFNMNDYLLFLVNENMTIQTQQTVFQVLSVQSWIALFYQIYKIYVSSHVTQKFISKLSKLQKSEKPLSPLYSQSQIYVLEYINSFLGDEKMYNFGQQAKIFEAIQKILEKTFGICLSDELANLKLNTTSLPFHDFMIALSKFLHHHLQQFGLAMFINPTDFFTMGSKEYLVFLISFMIHLLPYQNLQTVPFQTAHNEKSIRIIQLQNPSKNKSCKYWVKLFGSQNFQPQFKQIQLEPGQRVSIKVQYHCRSVSNQQARMILVPVENEEGFIPSHSLSFLLRNSVYSKTKVKKIKVKCCLYEIKTINLAVDLPIQSSSETEFYLKLAESSDKYHNQAGFHSFYILTTGTRNLKDGKDKVQLKFCPLSMGKKYCQVSYSSNNNSQYIYEIMAEVQLPNVCQQISLPALTSQKQEKIKIKINKENQFYENALKFHKQMSKKNKEYSMNKLKASKVKKKMIYSGHLQDQSYLRLSKQICIFDTNEEQNDIIQMIALFTKPYRQYSVHLIVQSENQRDIRKYQLLAHVSIKPKIISLSSNIKARETSELVLSNKIQNSFFRVDKKLQCLKIDIIEGTNDLLAIFKPEWIMKEEVKITLESRQNFQVCIYKLKLEAQKPSPIAEINIKASEYFETKFQIDLSCYNIPREQLDRIYTKTDLIRKHSIQTSNEQNKIIGIIKPGNQEGTFGIKVYLPKKQGYFEYKLNIKNIKVIQLPDIQIKQKILQNKLIIIQDVSIDQQGFQISYQPESWFSHHLQDHQRVTKTNAKNCDKKYNLAINFMPKKQINAQKIIQFRNQQKQYRFNVIFMANPIDSISLPLLKSYNMQQSKTIATLNNYFEAEGCYNIIISDPQNFKCDKTVIQTRFKDRIPFRISYHPRNIGDSVKGSIKLVSKTLPNLTYLIQGVSVFEVQREEIEIECFNNTQIRHSFKFINNFVCKQKFRFEVEEQIQNESMITNKGMKQRLQSEELLPKSQLFFDLYRPKSQNSPTCAKIYILKGFDKKIVKQIIVKFLIIKQLQSSQFHWQCKAREVIYENIKLPSQYILKQIKTDPEIRKCISYSGQQQSNDQIKLKFTSLKPIKAKKYHIILITNQFKFKVCCFVKVTEPPIDDTITIRTDQIKQVKNAVFRLTNIIRQPAVYKAYFLNGYEQFDIQPYQGVLQPYGKTGSAICIKFRSQVHNKRMQDKLYIETQQMLWIFKVVGIQSKMLKF